MELLTVYPAYGRDYRSHDEVTKGWNDGDSFELRSFASTRYVDKTTGIGPVIVCYYYGKRKSQVG